jgi:hypothetical protein
MSGCAKTGDVISNFIRVWNASSSSAFQTYFFVFLQKISDGFGDLKEVQDEPSIITHQSEGTADLMHSPWRLPI